MVLDTVTTQLPCFSEGGHRRPLQRLRSRNSSGNDQLQIAAGTGDTGITDHAVETFGMQLVQFVYSSLSSLRRGQVRTDVAVFQINVDDFVSF